MDQYTPNQGEIVAPATEVEETQEMVEQVEAAQPAPEEAQAPEAQPEANPFQQAVDTAAQALGLRSQEESQEIREEGIQENEELQAQLNEQEDVASESVRAVAGGLAGVVEQPVRFVQQVSGQEASFNLGIAENKTGIGNFARTAITMMGLMKGAGVAGVKVGAGASVSSRLATEAARGAVADFIMEEGDGNMSNMLEGMAPDVKDTFLSALAHDDDDNVWVRKLKNTAEGAVFGLAVDGIGEFISVLRAGRKAKAAGGSKEEVIKAMEAKQLELEVGSTKAKEPKKLGAHEVFMEASDGNLSRLQELDAMELRSLLQDYELESFISPRDILQNVDPFTSYKAIGEAIFNKQLPNGTNIEWALRDVSDQMGESTLSGRKVHRIDWDLMDSDAIAGGLGREATQMFRQFSEVVSDTLKPGDIMMTEAAEDGFGATGKSGAQKRAGEGHNVRQKLYERAGFSKADEGGSMFGVVRKDKKGRARLEPLDMTKDIDEQVAAAQAGSAVQESLDLDAADLDQITREQIAVTPETASAYNRVEAMRKGGIQPSWEDVSEVTPELFEPGTRVPAPEFHPSVYEKMNADGFEGGSFNPFTGEDAVGGNMVAIDKAGLEDLSPESVQEFIADNYDILTREDVYLGSWISDITGKPVVELSRRVEDQGQALALGRLYDQEAIWDNNNFQQLNTGGRDGLHKGGDMPTRDGVHDPGYDARVRESYNNNADSIETNLYEPNDRAGVTSGYQAGEALESMISASREGVPGGAKRVLNDDTIKSIAGAADPEEALSKAIRAVEGDGSSMAGIYERLRELRGEKFAAQVNELARALDLDEDNLKAYLEELVPDGEGGQIKRFMSDDGALTVRILQKDTANQIYDIARTAQELDEAGADYFKQATMLLDRLAVLDEMNIKHSYKSGAGLASRKNNWLNVGKEYDGEGAAARKKSQEFIQELRSSLERGDTAAAREFSTLVDALKVADGNPAKVEKFWGLFRKGLGGNLKAGMYNGMLSTTTSQQRNLSGNLFNTVLRPATQAIGFFGKENGMAQARIQMAAYNGLFENVMESFEVFKRSWDASGENSQVLRFDSGSAAKGREIVDAAKATAETQGEKAAAEFLELQYNFFQNPWVRMPTRALSAVDDAVRTLTARMELKKRAMESSWEKGQGFKVDEDRYAKLLDIYLNKDGAIMDQALLDNAKDVTFQTDLKGFGADLTAMIDRNPVLRLTMPFVKTPINIMRTTFSYTPFVSTFLNQFNQVMKNGDEATKALYRGREATGYMLTVAATGLAANGMITGNGPRDPEKKKIWLETNQPNSMLTPWGWVSYETLEPLNTILSMTADLTHTLSASNTSQYDQGWAQIAYTISAALFDKSYFRGITETVTLMNPNDPKWERLATGLVGNTVNNVTLPLSGLRNQIGKAMAPGKAEFDEWYQRALGTAIPGVRNVYGVDRESIFKEPTLDFGGHVNHLWNTMTPFDVKGTAHDGLAKRLGELGVDITTEFSDTFKGVEMRPSERNTLNRYLRETGIGNELDRLLKKDWFIKDVEQWKDSNLPNDYKPKWKKAITLKLNKAKRAAKARMLRENPSFAAKANLTEKINRALTRGWTSKAKQLQEELETLIDL